MTPSKQCKEAGLKSLAELSRLTGVPVSTLKDWHKTKPTLFEVMIDGALLKKANEVK